ncbi:MAG: hypothetical protein LUE17_01810, partial [Planctomycetaceae bacterium]|nr:hypothetical protein [Planctomycetaceae bacterium]
FAQPQVVPQPSAPVAVPAPALQAQPPVQMAQGGYQPLGYPQAAQAPGPVTAAAFNGYEPHYSGGQAPREPQMGFAARQPAPAVAERDPYGVVTRSDFAGTPERSHPYQNTSTKKRRADKLSEVATETSQKQGLGKVDLKPRPENRLPWWKGGFWRNDDDDDDDTGEKKSRAERKAEKKQAKLSAKEAKLAARKESGDDKESRFSLFSIF